MTRDLTFVTVVFDPEVVLLQLQARSMALYLEPSSVEEIIVLDNSLRGLSSRDSRRLRASYGALADRLQVIRTDELIDAGAAEGWRSQQAAKLAISARVRSVHYVALDAKNHFTRPVGADAFVAADGRAHGALHSYEQHPLRDSLERTLTYLGAQPAQVASATMSFPPTATPFVFHTALVRDMIADLESTSGIAFGAEFERRRLLEFFLYSGWLATRGPGIAAAIDGVSLPSPTVWPKAADVAGVEATIAEAAQDDAFVFAVHRQVLARADRATRRRIARHWTDVGLFADEDEAWSTIRRFRREYLPTIVATRLSERLRGAR